MGDTLGKKLYRTISWRRFGIVEQLKELIACSVHQQFFDVVQWDFFHFPSLFWGSEHFVFT